MWQRPTHSSGKADRLICTRCRATGRIQCETCGGKGQVLAGRTPEGQVKFTSCAACYGTKTMRCRNCSGEGYTR